MIYEFYKYEKEHGKSSVALDVNFGGAGRKWVFCNDPPNQRMCKCHKCKIKILREVPRIQLDASYHYGAGFYCLSCGTDMLIDKQTSLKTSVDAINNEVKNLGKIVTIAEEVMQDEFYAQKMALGKLCQVIGREDRR